MIDVTVLSKKNVKIPRNTAEILSKIFSTIEYPSLGERDCLVHNQETSGSSKLTSMPLRNEMRAKSDVPGLGWGTLQHV